MENFERKLIDDLVVDAEDTLWQLKKILNEEEDLPSELRDELMNEIAKVEQQVRAKALPKPSKNNY